VRKKVNWSECVCDRGAEQKDEERFLAAWADIIAGAMMKEKASDHFARNDSGAVLTRWRKKRDATASAHFARNDGGAGCAWEGLARTWVLTFRAVVNILWFGFRRGWACLNLVEGLEE